MESAYYKKLEHVHVFTYQPVLAAILHNLDPGNNQVP